MKNLSTRFWVSVLALLAIAVSAFAQKPSELVNLSIGTAKGTYSPGAAVPWGMVQVSPFTAWDPTSGKSPNNVTATGPWQGTKNPIIGFSHISLNGFGCSDLGAVLLMPQTGTVNLSTDSANHYDSAVENELFEPGYAKGLLSKYKVKYELTATPRTGLSRFEFPAGQSHIVLNLGTSLSSRTGAVVTAVSATEVEGYKLIGGCGGTNVIRAVYFVVRFSKPASEYAVYSGTTFYPGYNRVLPGDNIGAVYSWDTKADEAILAQVGISYTGVAGARANLDKEQSGFEFERVMMLAREAWNTELGKISVEGKVKEDLTRFYTALYHSLQHPNVFSDVDGSYLAYNSDEVKKAEDYVRYTNFNLFDTYKTLYPLLALSYPERAADIQRTLVEMSKENNGFLPRYEVLGAETYAAVGDPATVILADQYSRGLGKVDKTQLYEAVRKGAFTTGEENKLRPALSDYLKLGYVPQGEKNGLVYKYSATATLEYNLADFCAAKLATDAGSADDAKLLSSRALSFKTIWETKQKVVRPRLSNGKFLEKFEVGKLSNPEGAPGFVKGNTWHYSYTPTWDMKTFSELVGAGDPKSVPGKVQKVFGYGFFNLNATHDANLPFFFNQFPGEEWRTQKELRAAIRKFFPNKGEPIPAYDDAAGTSAWLVLSMCGLGQITPADGTWQIASPAFDKVTFTLNEAFYPGKQFAVEAQNGAGDAVYIKSSTWQGKPLPKLSLSHQELTTQGGTLSLSLAKVKAGK